jgi:hypothetical protein
MTFGCHKNASGFRRHHGLMPVVDTTMRSSQNVVDILANDKVESLVFTMKRFFQT